MSHPPATDNINNNDIKAYVRLAQSPEEIIEAQELRYKVFYEEYGAKPDKEMAEKKRDFDDFDKITDHLIVIVKDSKKNTEKIVGTYRLLLQKTAEKHGEFYSSDEYKLDNLIKSGKSLLELGRSCVLAEYRTKPILNLLWQGIANYITEHNVDILFGCASFHSTDINELSSALSYLHHFHSTPKDISPIAVKDRYVDMNIIEKDLLNERRVFASLPPLIKGYLRLGATIGDGAVIDNQFNTTDICIVVQTDLMSERYRKYYERKIQKTMPGQQ